MSDVRSSGEDRDSDGPRVESDTHSPNYWTRKLVKAEESDPYRYVSVPVGLNDKETPLSISKVYIAFKRDHPL